MDIKSPPTSSKYECYLCDCKFTRIDNMKRHIVTKHNTTQFTNPTAKYGNITAESSNTTTESSNITAKSSNTTAKSSNITAESSNENVTKSCPKCSKVFARKWNLTKHIEKCQGVRNILECEFCKKKFMHEKSKYKHYKVCKRDCTEIVPVSEIAPSTITNNNNNSTNIGTLTNNLTNNIDTQNNIQNQQNNNITIIYNPNQIEFKQDHITYEKLNSFLRMYPAIDRDVFIRHFGLLLENPENMCIKKEDIKSGYSEVHVGNNEWELVSDKKVYPNVITSVANNLSDLVNTHRDKLPKPLQKAIIKHCDYMSEQGYANTGDPEKDKEIEQEYKDGIRELKYEVHTKTRKKKKEIVPTPHITL